MVYQRKLQVPISEELNKKLLAKTKKAGFSSINEVTRLLLTSFAEGKLEFGFQYKEEKVLLSSEEELITLIKQARKDSKAGKLKTLDFNKSIHDQLMEMY